MLEPNEFRSRFPTFRPDQFPDSAVMLRLKLAAKFFEGWKDDEVREHAMCLYTAHYLTANKSVGSSGLGIVSGKSVDGASVSYDTGTASEQGAGFWNLTSYGRELYQLMRIFGAGAVQL